MVTSSSTVSLLGSNAALFYTVRVAVDITLHSVTLQVLPPPAARRVCDMLTTTQRVLVGAA